MPPLVNETFRLFERLFAPPGTAVEDRRRRTYISLSLVLLIPFVIGFGADDLRSGNHTEGALVMALALMLIGILIAVARVQNLRPIFRFGGVATLLLQLYELKIGGGDGYAFLWFYCIPILAMTVFGHREGTLWVLAAVASAALGFLTPFGHSYELERVLRFLITYLIVAALSYALESSRNRYYSELLRDKVALEDTLARIRTLRGLLPICARCKKVRDDEGYWQQIEDFVGRHSGAEFSHGICPKCMHRLFPELATEQASAVRSTPS